MPFIRVPADADAGGLPVPGTGDLPNSLISKGSRTGNDADLAGLVDIAGHNADLALVGRYDAGAVGPD